MTLHRRSFLKRLLILPGGLLAACTAAPTPTATTPANLTPTPVPAAVEDEVNILASGLDFPEGPAFDPQGNLWCTELLGGSLVKLVDGQLERIAVGGGPGGRGNGLAFDPQGRAWVADSGRNAILRYDPGAGSWETMLDAIDGRPLQAPNDLVFDAAGSLLFTCPNFASSDPTGYVVCLRPDGSASKIAEGYYRPNGLGLTGSAPAQALVVADTAQKVLYKGAWDAQNATWQDPQPWARVGGREGPDGMAPGADGLLYQAIYGDGVIRVIDAQGQVQREIRVPGANPTNVAIDPAGRLGLVVTETEHGQLLSFPGIQPGFVTSSGVSFA
jgi:gluconolactonase